MEEARKSAPKQNTQDRPSGTAATSRALPPALGILWRNRVPVAGLVAVALAVWGEALMRGRDDAPDPVLGAALVWVAALLVGFVAWVNDGLPFRRKAADVPVVESRAKARSYAWLRGRMGLAATLAGLLIVGSLAAWTYSVLSNDFRSEFAPWLWVATLAALALTFVGVRAWPRGAGLVPRDPGEPNTEPRISRGEWLAIGGIMLVAVVVRLWNLENVPLGPYTDEGDRAFDARHINQGIPVGGKPFAFFGTGWWGVPNFYFWLLGQSLRLFGDNLTGARMVHALAGIATVWVVYRIGRAVWSPRAGLLAAAMLTVSDFAIQFSRTAGESTISILTWAACFYYLYRALDTRRPLDFVWSGIAGGLTLYGYASGKLLPIALAVIGLYVLLRWGRKGIVRFLPGLALTATSALLTFAPQALYLLSHPASLTERYDSVTIFTRPTLYFGTYNTTDWGVVLVHQFQLTFAAFDTGQERGPFYPTNMPILPIVWAAVWLLGVAYTLWRAGDVRFAMLGVWIVTGLAGAALTNDTPTLQRVAGMVPTLALVPAVFLDRLGRGAPALRWRPRLSLPARATRLAFGALLLLLVAVVGLQNLDFYFRPYAAASHYYWYTLAGRYVEKLDPKRDAAYQMDVPEFYWYSGPSVFLAKDVAARDLANMSDDMPLLDKGDKNAHFLVFPSNSEYMPILETYYPGGTTQRVNRPPSDGGSPFFAVYRVDTSIFDARRQIMAHYGPASGPLFEREEPRLGTNPADGAAPPMQPPSGMSYPLRAEWSGGLVAPAYGTYRLSLAAGGGAGLEIDGRRVLTGTASSSVPAEAQVVLASGLHQVRLIGTLPSADAQVDLRWGSANSPLVPISRTFLWAGPMGTLLGESYPNVPNPGWFTEAQPKFEPQPPLDERLDGVLAWRGINDSLRGGPSVFADWRGTLRIPNEGSYGFEIGGSVRASLLIDGKPAGGQNLPGVAPMPITMPLAAGEHSIEVRAQAMNYGAGLDLYWTPPGKQQEILPPTALAPAAGGVWLPEERPSIPGPDPAKIGAVAPVLPVRVSGKLTGGANWQQARGVAVLRDRRVVVGDTGNHRLLLYGSDGKQLAAWGSAGNGPGQFDTISDVAVSGDDVIAALDAEGGVVQLFDTGGKLISRFGRPQFLLSHASGIAWGPDGKLYVADTAGGRVVRITRDGVVEAEYRTADKDHLGLEQPVDVAVAQDGTIYVVDLHGRVASLNSTGLVDHDWSVPVGTTRGGSHITVWGDKLAVTDPEANSISVVDLTRNIVSPLQLPAGSTLNLQLPIGVASGPDGRLYVLNSDANNVLVLEAVP